MIICFQYFFKKRLQLFWCENLNIKFKLQILKWVDVNHLISVIYDWGPGLDQSCKFKALSYKMFE